MRICVTSKGKELTDQVDERFGRCSYLLLIDPATAEVEAVKNPGVLVDHGAGIAAAQRVMDSQVEVLVTGHLGPNAEGVLASDRLTVYQAKAGTVQSVLDDFVAGKLKQILPAKTGSEK